MSGLSLELMALSHARPSAHIVIVALTAVLVGLVDAAMVVTGIGGAGSFQFVPSRIWLIGPLVWTVVAVPIALVLLPLMKRWGSMIASATLVMLLAAIRLQGQQVWLFAVVAVLGVLIALLRGRIMAWVVQPRRALAIGIVGGLGAAAIVAAVVPLTRASARPPADAGRPNVIVIFLDTVRYDAVFDAGGGVHPDLPALARLRAQGTAFTRAYAASSWTLPSTLAAVTGLPAHELGVSFDSQVYDRPDPTLAERFHRRGYRTAAVISNSFLNAGSGFARGFDTFEEAQAGLDLCRTAPGIMGDTYWPWFSASVCNWTASDVTRRAQALMDDTDGPFFLTLNYMDAHDPYYVERACGEPQGYAAAIRCLDRSLGPIVDWHSSRRPTVLAVVGDHGEQFGEHGLTHHGNSLFVQLLHVPLIVRSGPAATSADVNAEPISIAALPSLVDGSNPAPPPQGPVRSVLYPQAATQAPALWSALDGTWHLISRERGRSALYNLMTDPLEEHDVFPEAPSDPDIARLRAAIDEMRRAPKPDLRTFRSLGYVH